MALTARQKALYVHAVDIWRFTVTITASGKPGQRSWTRVATAVPCYVETGTSQHRLESLAGLMVEGDNLFTMDPVHFEGTVDVQAGDVLRITQGPEAGEYRTVRGEPKLRTRRANKRIVLTNRPEAVDAGISSAYA